MEAHLAGDLDDHVRMRGGGRAGSPSSAAAATPPCSAPCRDVWPLIERGRTRRGDGSDSRCEFGDLPELAGDGGSLIRLYHGQPAEIRAAALPLLPRMLASLPVDKEWLPEPRRRRRRALGAGHRRRAAPGLLYDALAPWSDLFLVDGIGAACSGSVELVLAQLAALREQYDVAARSCRPGPRGQRRDRPGPGPSPTPSAPRRRCSPDAGHPGDEDAAPDAPRGGSGVLPPGRDRRAGRRGRGGCSAPALPRSTWARRPGCSAGRGRSGSVAWRGREATLPAVKGMTDLAVLLAQPERETHVLDLVGAAHSAPRGDLGEVIDAPAREAYRARLAELDERLAEAEASGDAGASEQAAREREFLLAELGAAYGLGGRARRAGRPGRARPDHRHLAGARRDRPHRRRAARARSAPAGLGPHRHLLRLRPRGPDDVGDPSHVVRPDPTPEG